MKSLKINTGATRNELERTDHIKAFIKTLYGGKPLSKEQENQMFREYLLTKNQALKDKIVKSNMRFVFSAAKAFTNDPETVLDLTMEGMLGLLEAFDKFDPHTNNSFLSFANHYVYKYMVDYTHGSEHVKRSKDFILKSKTSRIKEAFFAENGRYPSDDEVIGIIKEKYGIDVKKEDYIREIVITSLDSAYVDDGEPIALIDSPDFIEQSGSFHINNFIEEIEEEDTSSKVMSYLSVLSERDQLIMKKLFGIGYYREFTPEEVADEFEMTVARVNQIKKEAIEKIRKNRYSIAV